MHRDFLYVPDEVVRQILTPADAVHSARRTLLDLAGTTVDWAVPRQSLLAVAETTMVYKVKGCALGHLGVAGFRVVGPMRAPDGRPTASLHPTRHVLLSDIGTGSFFGIVDERSAYALRTGACAAVAVEALRRADSRDCSLIGTGSMAYHAALAVNEVMQLDVVRVHSRNEERRRRFADRLEKEIGVEVEAVGDARECVRQAGVVVTATSAREPMLKHEWLRPGVVVYAMGGGHEWDRDSYRNMRVVVDDREQSMLVTEIRKWSADGSFDVARDVEADLAEVVSGDVGRTTEGDQFFVRSQGLVTQDVAQAYWVYEQAVATGRGISLEPALVERPGDGLF